ncbi:23S rRNA (adenine(2503)-C(2))-methyltransferase RlmN [Cyanobacterium sp. uoEpiScrs1]|uniref:23S rRNA (adenine(2503)-C(2))-methyltransferase RlmN n=1 Tax=Cyanobacterium sp. uoEpiScrs1 TaxID=2976343 RepID=UPI00226A7834|nr:23S rRNA (adenine(2503)-C(2))-methyltransferase RlmN [Cyanobacterium sp. uoEpiScrs1]
MISTEETLLGKSLEELTYWAQQQGQPAYRGKQLHQWLYQKGARSLEEIHIFPKTWREKLKNYPVGRSKIKYRTISQDNTRKYLLSLDDGLIIEVVGIPTTKRLTVCVSSQVGCPMACNFCATGKGGYDRNLKAHEIVDQVLTVQKDFQRRVSHVVFMGMGEPLLNFEAVISAIKILNQDMQISQRSLTISTVGLPQKIIKLANQHLQVTFAISLHASNQALREKLIPSASSYPIKQLLEDCRKYVEITRRRITFEYILLEGVNNFSYHAIELANKLRGFQSHVNLIPYNPIEGANYQRPSQDKTQTFVNILKQQKIAVSIRYSRGLEANAACGQLRYSDSF